METWLGTIWPHTWTRRRCFPAKGKKYWTRQTLPSHSLTGVRTNLQTESVSPNISNTATERRRWGRCSTSAQSAPTRRSKFSSSPDTWNGTECWSIQKLQKQWTRSTWSASCASTRRSGWSTSTATWRPSTVRRGNICVKLAGSASREMMLWNCTTLPILHKRRSVSSMFAINATKSSTVHPHWWNTLGATRMKSCSNVTFARKHFHPRLFFKSTPKLSTPLPPPMSAEFATKSSTRRPTWSATLSPTRGFLQGITTRIVAPTWLTKTSKTQPRTREDQKLQQCQKTAATTTNQNQLRRHELTSDFRGRFFFIHSIKISFPLFLYCHGAFQLAKSCWQQLLQFSHGKDGKASPDETVLGNWITLVLESGEWILYPRLPPVKAEAKVGIGVLILESRIGEQVLFSAESLSCFGS